MADVLEQIDDKLASNFNIQRYLKDVDLWDTTVKKLLALPAVGSYALQVAGRFDIASNQVFGTPELDWVLLVYNGIKRIGTFGVKDTKKTINLALDPLDSFTTEIPLLHARLDIKVGDTIIPKFLDTQGRTEADVDGDANNELLITPTSTGAKIENLKIAGDPISFVIVFKEEDRDDFLNVGTVIPFPSLAEVTAVLTEVQAEEERKVTGFARL